MARESGIAPDCGLTCGIFNLSYQHHIVRQIFSGRKACEQFSCTEGHNGPTGANHDQEAFDAPFARMIGQASASRDVLSPTPPGPEGSNGNGLLRVQWDPGAWLIRFPSLRFGVVPPFTHPLQLFAQEM